jgi:formylglycine-generating enzyme required for sulfatase activity
VAVTDPPGPTEGECRVTRGGFCDNDPWYCRSTYRTEFYPNARTYFIGFRVVVEVAPTKL